jgi:hypothetical protein
MSLNRRLFAVFVFFSVMLNVSAASSADEPRSKRIPLDLYTSQACNEKGVNFTYYEGGFGSLDFSKAKPVKQGKLKQIDLSPRKRDQEFGIKFTGHLKAVTTGLFEFFLHADNAGKLYVDSKVVVDAGKNRGEVRLAEGVHTVTIAYYQGGGDKSLHASYRAPFPWHVKDSDIRVPVRVAPENAWGQMPPQAYLADLQPIEVKDLTFDPKTKSAILRDIRSPEDKAKIIAQLKERCRRNKQEWKPEFYRLHGNPIMRVRGSATYAIKPEYKWFSYWRHAHVEVRIDGKPAGIREGQHGINPGDPRFPAHKQGRATVVPIPPKAKKLTIRADAEWIKQPGFITRRPAVARVSLYLSAHDPTELIPLVYDMSGKRVGCRILWAHPGEPMSILLDCSSGERLYMVYFVDRSKNPQRLKWIPQAGLIFEARYPRRYDPAVRTVDGFLKLWDSADIIAGKKEMARIWKMFFPFRPLAGTTPDYRSILGGTRMELASYTGFFHAPSTQAYQFHYKTQPGGYFLIDNQLVSQFKYREAEELAKRGSRNGYKRFAVELTKGIHRLEILQYGSAERFSTMLGWGLPGKENDLEPFGNNERAATFSVWESIADAVANPILHREKDLHASFTWQHRHQCWGKFPGKDIICLSLSARLTKNRENAVYRWRFEDGHTAEGSTVQHHFLSPGRRKVHLDVLDKPDGEVIAGTSGVVHAHINWSWPQDADRSHVVVTQSGCRAMIAKRVEELATVTPIDEVVSLYYWGEQNHWLEFRSMVLSALSKRIDEVIKKFSYIRLLELAQSMAAPMEANYDAAEKLLRVVIDRAPVGSRHWKIAAMALAEILIAARDKPQPGLALLGKLKTARPTVNLTRNWQIAEAKQWYCLTEADRTAAAPQGLSWSNTVLPLEIKAEEGRGIWLGKDIDLPASRKGKELVISLGRMPGNGAVWFNGKWIGSAWKWPDGYIVIPAGVQVPGGKNRFTVLFQPKDPPGYFARLSAPAFSPDLKRLAWAGRDNTVRLRDADKGKELLVMKGHPLGVRSLAFSSDGKYLASGSHDKTIKIWDTGNGNELRTFKGHAGEVISIAFSPDTRHLASGSRDNTIKLWNTNGSELRTLKGHSGEVLSVAFSADGKRLASASRDSTVRVWDTSNGSQQLTMNGHSGPVYSVAFSPDGKKLASAGHDKTIRIWDTGTGKEIRRLGGHSDHVLSIAISPDGKRLASGSRDQHIRLWNMESGGEIAARGGHGNHVLKIAFSSDSKHMASASHNTIKFWNGENAHEQRNIPGHGSEAHSVTLRVPGPKKEPASKGYTYPMVLYTSKPCAEPGVNYAYYEGKWDKLPDFDKLKSVKEGRLKTIDLSPKQRDENFGMKFTGYINVLSPDLYTFSVKSDNGSRLRIGSQIVIDNPGNESYDTQGKAHLAEGVHPVTLTYFQSHAAFSLAVTLPNTHLPASTVASQRYTADALLGIGQNAKARAVLINMRPGAWPITERTRLRLTSDLRKIRKWALGNQTDTVAAMDNINSWLHNHPMLRMDPEFMATKVEAYTNMGDYARAFTLVEQMRRVDMSDHQRRGILLVQVKCRIRAKQMDMARKIYEDLKKIAPYSTETVEARKAIKEAIVEK